MTNFDDLSKKPSRFLSFTSLTVEEFLALLPVFTIKFQQYMEKFTLEGKIRKKRQYVEYKNASLPIIENKLLFILTYLKGNDLQEKIGEMFDMSQPKANLWIHVLHIVLNQTLNDIDMLPSRNADDLRKKLDSQVGDEIEVIERKVNIETKVIESEINVETETTNQEIKIQEATDKNNTKIDIDLYFQDGSERPINRPLDDAIQKIFYSGKQKQHTVKNILFTDVGGYVHFLSWTCEGKKNDKKAADEIEYNLPEGIYLCQDTGFQGFEISGVNIVQPKKKPRGGKLTKKEKEQNRVISSVRVRVEHAICGVKRCRIVKDKLRNWKHRFKDFVMETCCGLHNFRLGFRPWNYEIAVI